MKHKNVLRDTLYNTDIDCTMSVDRPSMTNKNTNQVYAQGILVGVVGTLMAVNGWTLKETRDFLIDYVPAELDQSIVPAVWQSVLFEGNSRTYK